MEPFSWAYVLTWETEYSYLLVEEMVANTVLFKRFNVILCMLTVK